jgi:tRNA nucleotidyltransferase (CCA-adding enzyme)
LRGFQSTDIDIVVKGDFRPLLSRIASSTDGKIIDFEKGGISRIILDTTTIDFTALRGSIEEDLSRRDFTMNAIAWSPESGIVDPLEGLRDIQREIIRALSRENLTDDPIRLLRTYRFAGEFGWRIDSRTRIFIRELKESLKLSSFERITLEFLKLLNSKNHLKALKLSYADGLLNIFLAIDSRDLLINIKALSRFKSFLEKIPNAYFPSLERTISQGLSHAGLLRAEVILFKARLEESRLRLSNAILKRLKITSMLLDEFQKAKSARRQQLFDLFYASGVTVLDFALLTRNKKILHEAMRFVNMSSLLPTEEIMNLTGVKGGAELGSFLKEMKRMQFLGKIAQRGDALRFFSTGPTCLETFKKPMGSLG